MGLVSAILPVFARELGATGIWLGLVFASFTLSMTPLMPIIGNLSDKLGRKKFVVAGLAVYILVGAAFVWAPGYKELILIRIFAGVGAALIFPTTHAYIGDLSPKGEEGKYMGIFNTAFYLGWGIGPFLGGALKDLFNMDTAFYAMTIISTVAMAIALVFLPSDKPTVQNDSNYVVGKYTLMLKDNIVKALITFQLIYGINAGIILSFLAVFMDIKFGASATIIGLVIACRVMLSGALQPPFGYLADKVNRFTLICVGSFIIAVGMLSVPHIPNIAGIFYLFAFLAIFEGMTEPAAMAIMVDKGRTFGMGRLTGLNTMAWGSGTLVAGFAGGFIMDSVGLEYTFRLATITGILGTAAIGAFYIMSKSRTSTH
jgi:MFS family permease